MLCYSLIEIEGDTDVIHTTLKFKDIYNRADEDREHLLYG